MHGEAFAYAKYMLFAERARQRGNAELAELLEKTAKEELLEHFAEEAGLAELVRGDATISTTPFKGSPTRLKPCTAILRSRHFPPATKLSGIALMRFVTTK
jgi:rubrerythrin